MYFYTFSNVLSIELFQILKLSNIMQVRNFFILILICFFGCIFEANAQRVIENENGDRIIVYSDGSWKYFDENDPLDTELLKRLANAQSNPAPSPAPEPPVSRKKTKKVKTKKTKSSKSVAKTKSKKPQTTRSKKTKIPSPAIAGVIPRIKKVQKVSQQKVSQAEYLEKQLTNNRDKLKKQLQIAMNTDNVSENQIESLQRNLSISTSKLKKAKKARKNVVKYAKMADALNTKKGTEQVQSLLLLEGAMGIKRNTAVASTTQPTITQPGVTGSIPATSSNPISVPTTPATPNPNPGTTQPVGNVSTESALYNTENTTQPYVNYTRKKPIKKLVKYNPKEDAFLNPKMTKSKLAHDGVDEFTGKKIREVGKETFFTHTSENLRAVLKGRDYLTCVGYISSQTGGIKILNLKFDIASDLAQQEFGIIDKGSVLTVKLLDGSAIRLLNKKTDIGVIDPVNKSTTYSGQYIITNKDEKALSKSEVDKVRVVWSTGYEDYDIYEMDFLIKQLNCINSKK